MQQAERRIVEATRMGFKRIICPDARWPKVKGAELVPVKTLDHALQQLN